MHDLELQSASLERLRLKDVPEIIEIQRIAKLAIWSERDYAEVIDNEDYRCLVLKLQSKIAGFINMRLIKSENLLEILNVAVLPELQHSGHGQKLLSAALNLCNDNNIAAIILEVRRSNQTALKFYRKNGFTFVGERRDYYREPTEDALQMRLDLKKLD